MKQAHTILTPGSPDKLFAEIYSRNSEELRSYILKHIYDTSVADDIIQEIFMKLWEKRETICQIDNIAAFLFRSARNEFIDHIRKESHGRKLRQHLMGNQPPIVNATEEIICQKETEALLQQAIQSLTPQRRKVYLYGKIEGLPLEKVAVLLNISRRTVVELMRLSNLQVRKYMNERMGTSRKRKYKVNKVKKGGFEAVKILKAA